ncbi:recombinase family protein [uncultured Fusobacterium sp.]|jgi:site-specific DNA recombinase|uniref:recombinase family protein n=1 Tax=uncultured Fusobacterium sp. TaxID=159267 RepID=UPI0025D0F4DC|nr:recombinase family protein [uncultured Fusobacterium sp.]
MKRAVIYIRESTKFQDPDTQEKECRAYCKENDFQIVKTYRDIASGKKNDRKGFLQMLDDLDEDRFDVLVLWELSRSTRDFITYKTLLDTLIQNNKELHSLQEGILTQDDIDVEFSNDIRALINAHERKRVGRRIKFRKNFKTREGYWTNGQAPFGYKLDNGVLIPDEEEAPVVKEIFELFIAGATIREIGEKFNIPWRRISRVLTNVVYLGKLKVNETEMINDKRVRNKEVEIIEGKHAAIINEDTFSLANSLKRKKPNKYKNGKFILPNVYCWTGERMYPFTSLKQEYYSTKFSRHYVDREFLEKIVLDNILNFNFDTLNENMEVVDYTERREFYKKEVEKLKNNEKKLLKKYLDNVIGEDVFDNFMQENKKNIIEFEKKISEIEKLILNSSKKEDNAKLLKEYLKALKNTKDRVQLQQILNILISEIRLVNNFRCVVITTIF